MGGIAALISRDGCDVTPMMLRMLRALKHRGREAYGVAAGEALRIGESPLELLGELEPSDVAVGYCLSRNIQRDEPQPIRDGGVTLVFDGRVFKPEGISEPRELLKLLNGEPESGARAIIEGFKGFYTFVVMDPRGRLIAGRDVTGVNPLYYSWDGSTYALASERKALWSIGVKDARSFPPGSVAVIERRGASFKSVKSIAKPSRLGVISVEEAAGRLRKLLLDSLRRMVEDVESPALAFSGGLDSSLIAALSRECRVDVQLITVGLEGSVEIEHARVIAEKLGLKLQVKLFTEDDVEEALDRVLWMIEGCNPVDVSIAIPLCFVAEEASKLGFRVLLSGQGGDELFGGYHRYLEVYERFGVEGLEETLYLDVVNSYKRNFERDNKVCSFHGLELRLPFIDLDLIEYSLSIPVNLKVESSRDPLRKRILRRIAEDLELPPSVYMRKKRAIQYSTGVSRILQKLARGEGLSIRGYLSKRWEEVRSRNMEKLMARLEKWG